MELVLEVISDEQIKFCKKVLIKSVVFPFSGRQNKKKYKVHIYNNHKAIYGMIKEVSIDIHGIICSKIS